MNNKTLLLVFVLWVGPLWAANDTPTVKPTKTPRLSVLRLFTDKKDCAYIHPYPPDTSKCVVLLKNHKRWADMKLNGTDKSGIYLSVDMKDLTPYLAKGALQFYIRGNKGGEILKEVGFRMDQSAKHKFNFATTVPLGDYCSVTTKWKIVTIPLSEFPLTGKYLQVDEETRRREKAMNRDITNSSDQLFHSRFDWGQVVELEFEHDANDEAEIEIQITNVVILPEYRLKTVVREKENIE